MRKRGGGCGKRVALAIGSNTARVVQVKHETVASDLAQAGASGYTVWFEDAPHRELIADDCWLICTHCLSVHHPEAKAGMEIARRSGVAVWHEGSWQSVGLEGP